MQNDYYKGCRVEISYPSINKDLFEKVQMRFEKQYAGAELRGKGNDKDGASMMISLVFIPKEHALHTPVPSDDPQKKAESNPVGQLYDSASAVIDTVLEESNHA